MWTEPDTPPLKLMLRDCKFNAAVKVLSDLVPRLPSRIELPFRDSKTFTYGATKGSTETGATCKDLRVSVP